MILFPHPVPEVKGKRGQRKEEEDTFPPSQETKPNIKKRRCFHYCTLMENWLWRFICSPDLREGRGEGQREGRCVWGGGGGGDFKQGQPNDAQHTQQLCKLSVVILTYGRYSRSLLRVYGCPQGNRLGKISSSNLQDEAPTPLPVVGPLFPPCYFIVLESC